MKVWTQRNTEDGIEAIISLRADGLYTVRVRDFDADMYLPEISIYNTIEVAQHRARSILAGESA